MRDRAIRNLYPTVTIIDMHGKCFTDDGVEVTINEDDVATEIATLVAEFQAKQYQRERVYPSIGDQLDMLWHAIDNGTLNKTSEFYTAIKAVKDAYPKSE